ncbi:MAG: LacI family DNA-binding transcriptional regulator [Pseudorhodoplanes sp.]|nr:LacI family DNA-binding transcriptional regulator [Pseudorhodoplanes sp.]
MKSDKAADPSKRTHNADRTGQNGLRPHARDIARAAGVSPATVDRVLNRRPGVRAATAQRVIEAAATLNYLPRAELYEALRPKPMRLSFLLPSGTNRYLRMLGEHISKSNDQLSAFNVSCHCHFVEGFNPEALAKSLRHHARRADGIAFMALDHPLVRNAAAELGARGIPMLTLISDIPGTPRTAYVGLNNRAAGRSAGLLIGRFVGERRGKVALIAGSRSYRAHEERETGFLGIIEDAFPALTVVGLREGHDDATQNYRQTRALLAQHPDIVGIYNIGGASDGIARALREANRASMVTFIGHGLTPDTQAALIDGTMDVVITQDHHIMVLNCVRIFTNLREGRAALFGIEPMQISLFVRENLS